MTDYSVVIEILLTGLAQVDELAKSISTLRRSASNAEKTADSLGKVEKAVRKTSDAQRDAVDAQKQLGAQAFKSQNQIAALAGASARLQQAQGNTAGAVKTLQGALKQLDEGSLAYYRTQKQITDLQNNYANSPLIGAVRGQAQAFNQLDQSAQDSSNSIQQATNSSAALSQAFAALAQQQQAVNKPGEGGGFVNTLTAIGDVAGAVSNLITLYLVTESAQQKVKSGASSLGQVVKAAFQTSASEVSRFQNTVANAVDSLQKDTEAGKKARKVGEQIVDGLTAGIKSEAPKSAKIIQEAVDKYIISRAKERLGISSPSRVFATIGQQTIDGFISGVRSRASQARRAVEDVIRGAVPTSPNAENAVTAGLPDAPTTRRLSGNIDGIVASMRSFASTAGITAVEIGVLGAAVGALVIGLGTLVVAAAAAVPILIKIGNVGIAANSKLEQLDLGIASIIASVAELRNDKGLELKGVDALNAALPVAQDQLQKLRVDALQTALTFDQLADGFLQAVGPGLTAGLNLDQIRKTVIDLSQLIGPLTGQTEQLGQELRAIFSGDINQDSQVAKALQITKEQVLEAQKAGRFAEFLNEKLAIAAVTGARMAKTFEAAKSNLEEAGNVLSQQVTKGFFTSLRDKLNQTLPQIFTVAAGKINIAPAFAGLATFIEDLFDRAGSVAIQAIDEVLSVAQGLSAFLEQNRGDINLLLDTIGVLTRAIYELGREIVRALGTNAANTLKFLVDTIADLARLVAVAKDAFELLGAAGALAINAIIGAIYEAGVALNKLGFEIEGAEEGLARAEARAAGLRDRLNEGFVNARKVNEELTRQQQYARLTVDAGNAVPVDASGKPIGSAGVLRDKFSTLPALPSIRGRAPKLDTKDKDKTKTARALRDNAEQEIKAETDLQRALLALKNAFAEREEQRAKNALTRETALLEQALEDRSIGITAFFAKRKALIEETTALEVQAIERQIAAQRDRFAEIDQQQQREIAAVKEQEKRDIAATKKAEERANIRTKAEQKLNAISDKAEKERTETDRRIIELESQIDTARSRGEEKTAEAARKRIVALRDFQNSVAEAAAELQTLEGDQLPAALLQIDGRFRDTLAFAKQEFGAASEIVAQIQKLIDKLKAVAKANEAIRQARLGQDVAEANLELGKVQVENQVVAGLLTERQARKEILELQREYVRAVLPQIDKEIEATKLLGKEHEAELIRLKARRAALLQLTIDTEAFNRRLSKSLQENLLSVLDQLGDQITTVKEAFTALANGILRDIKRIVSEKLIDQLFGARKGKDGETKPGLIPSFIDKIVGFFTGKKDEGVLGQVTGAAPGQTPEVQATNLNTQALNNLTKAIGGISGTLGGQGGGINNFLNNILGGSGNAPGITPEGDPFESAGGFGETLGNLAGTVVGAVTGEEQTGGGKSLVDVLNSLVKVLNKLNGVLGGGSTEAGGLAGDLVSAGTSIAGGIISAFAGGEEGEGGGNFDFLGGLLGGGAAGGTGQGKTILEAVNLAIKAIDKNTEALNKQSGGGGDISQLATLFAGGFAEGGFTGIAGLRQAVGVVHGREYVFSAPAVQNLGVGYLDALHSAARQGYEMGGFVHRDFAAGGNATLDAQFGAQTAPVVNVRNVNVFDPKDVAAAMVSSHGEIALLNLASKRAPELRARLGLNK